MLAHAEANAKLTPFVNAYLRGEAYPPKQRGVRRAAGIFVLLSEARSGTSWLAAMLDSHPQIAMARESEVFLPLHKKRIALATSRNLSCAFCLPHGSPWPHIGREIPDTLEWWLHTSAASKSDASAVGFKLLNGQAGLELSGGAWDPPDGFHRANLNDTALFMLWLEHERARIIVLERQGLGRLVSQAVHDRRVQAGVAGPNGSAWCNSPECVARVTRDGSDLRVALPTARLADRLDREVVKWSALLTKLRRRFYPQMLHVSYDDLMAGTSYQMERIVTFLGANASLPIDLGATLKLTSERLGDSLVNADAVEAELRGTRWELAPPPDEEAAPAALNT